MRKSSSLSIFGCVVALGLMAVGCGQVADLQARMAFREGNSLYQGQDWVMAAEKYEEVVATNPTDPQLLTTYFFLGNSYDNQYSPGRQNDPVNDALLTNAIDNYKTAVEVLADANPEIRTLSLQYLVAAYGPDKLGDPSLAEPLLQQMIQEDPDNSPTYFILSRLHEDLGEYDRAEAALVAAREARPDDASVYTTLAAYYDRQGDFDNLIQALEARTAQEPNNPEAFYTIATYYFNKSSRDFSLSDAEKTTYAESGVVAVDKAIALNGNYMEALVFKNLLLRQQANLEPSVARQNTLLAEADELRDRAEEIRLERAAGVAESSS